MSLVPVTAPLAVPVLRARRSSAWTPPADDGWTMPRRGWEIPHAPPPLDAISAYRDPLAGPVPLLLDVYA